MGALLRARQFALVAPLARGEHYGGSQGCLSSVQLRLGAARLAGGKLRVDASAFLRAAVGFW